jgi:hypothetical protein
MEETVEVWETEMEMEMENRMIHYLDETPKGFKITSPQPKTKVYFLRRILDGTLLNVGYQTMELHIWLE